MQRDVLAVACDEFESNMILDVVTHRCYMYAHNGLELFVMEIDERQLFLRYDETLWTILRATIVLCGIDDETIQQIQYDQRRVWRHWCSRYTYNRRKQVTLLSLARKRLPSVLVRHILSWLSDFAGFRKIPGYLPLREPLLFQNIGRYYAFIAKIIMGATQFPDHDLCHACLQPDPTFRIPWYWNHRRRWLRACRACAWIHYNPVQLPPPACVSAVVDCQCICS